MKGFVRAFRQGCRPSAARGAVGRRRPHALIGWALVASLALIAGCNGRDNTGAGETRNGGATQAADAEQGGIPGDERGSHDAHLARGEILSFACRACHGLAPGDPSPLGPPLHGMFGRPAASLPDFKYSRALKESGIVWTEETLDAWLARPDGFIPGNDMAFAGFRSADDRRALIAYLKMQTAP